MELLCWAGVPPSAERTPLVCGPPLTPALDAIPFGQSTTLLQGGSLASTSIWLRDVLGIGQESSLCLLPHAEKVRSISTLLSLWPQR